GALRDRERDVGGEVAVLGPLGALDGDGGGRRRDDPVARHRGEGLGQKIARGLSGARRSLQVHHLHVVSTRTYDASSYCRSGGLPALLLDREQPAAALVVLVGR